MRDEAVAQEFGDLLPEVLQRFGFREVGRYVDNQGWFTRTYSNGRMGIRLVFHMCRAVEFMPRRNMEAYTNIEFVGDFFGDPIRDDSPSDDKARYIERNWLRLERLFGELDGGEDLRALEDYLRKRRAKLERRN